LCNTASPLTGEENEVSGAGGGKGVTARFRDIESIYKCSESGVILAFHGENQLDVVASLQQDKHFTQVIISASRYFPKLERVQNNAEDRYSYKAHSSCARRSSRRAGGEDDMTVTVAGLSTHSVPPFKPMVYYVITTVKNIFMAN
jgi:hypothetical protein